MSILSWIAYFSIVIKQDFCKVDLFIISFSEKQYLKSLVVHSFRHNPTQPSDSTPATTLLLAELLIHYFRIIK